MILRFLFFVFLFYMLFKLVFNFIIPLYRTTRKVKQGFREMHQKMQEQQGTDAYQQAAQNNGSPQSKAEPLGDYIDFEEVKE
jgi:hypothetical protein